MSAPKDASVTPSLQPTHIAASIKILKEDATGYIAPAFAGKERQMELGS
jgi:hypothetical protein